MKAKHYEALAFDFDGTLFDTAELNYRAYKLAYFDLGIEIDEAMFRKTHGLSVYEFNQAMGVECDVERLRVLKAKYYKDYVLYAKPNLYLINLIEQSSLRKVLVTTARMCNIKPLLDKYNIFNKFDSIITQEDVKKHKPDPEAYNIAMKDIGVNSRYCLAFEDSRAGFVAARSAGLDCIMIKRFEKDCLVDATGGSEAKTKIYFEGDMLIVKKMTTTADSSERLRNQYNFLEQQKDYYVEVYEKQDGGDLFSYCMPYVMGVNLYEYQNKIKMLPMVMDQLYQASRPTVGNNQKEITEEIITRYIKPGIDVLNRCTGWGVPYPELSRKVNLNDYLISNYHGDATFENVIIQRDDNIVFIDPLPDRNIINGLLQDFAKLGQSLYGYEAIKEHKNFDYTIERKIYERRAMRYLSENEFKSLKVHIACMFFRRLKYQERQDKSLVAVFGRIALQLIDEFNSGNFSF